MLMLKGMGMGAADVVPFIPLRGCDTAEAVALARETAALVASRYQLPIYLYEQAASAPQPAASPITKR